MLGNVYSKLNAFTFVTKQQKCKRCLKKEVPLEKNLTIFAESWILFLSAHTYIVFAFFLLFRGPSTPVCVYDMTKQKAQCNGPDVFMYALVFKRNNTAENRTYMKKNSC